MQSENRLPVLQFFLNSQIYVISLTDFSALNKLGMQIICEQDNNYLYIY